MEFSQLSNSSFRTDATTGSSASCKMSEAQRKWDVVSRRACVSCCPVCENTKDQPLCTVSTPLSEKSSLGGESEKEEGTCVPAMGVFL